MDMKRILLLFVTGIFLLLSGCLDDDGYSLGKVWIDFGVVEKTGSGNLDYRIITDDDDVLYPVATEYPFDLEDGNRIMVNYTILGDKKVTASEKEYYARINSIKKILKKGILDITPANEDSIGNDPVLIVDHWTANNLLNFKLKYWGDTEVHFINLVKQPGTITAANQPVELELRHNRNGDREKFPFAAYVSFDLSAIKVAGLDSVRYRVSATNYDGDVLSFTGVYK